MGRDARVPRYHTRPEPTPPGAVPFAMASPRAVSARRLNSLLQQAREPMLLLDEACRIVFVNRAWEQLTGHDAGAVLGLVCQPQGAGPVEPLDQLSGSFCPPPEALDGQPCGGMTLIVHPGGERIWRRVEFWPLHDESARRVGLVGLVREPQARPQTAESDSQRLRAELQEVRQRLLDGWGQQQLIGRGPAHRRLLDQIATAAAMRTPALIVGEPGTGKRLIARLIHQRGSGAQAPLIHFDPAALPPELLARELFGPEPVDPVPQPAPPDRCVLAEGTTLILGDVVDLPRDLQARLTRALEVSPVRLLGLSQTDPDQARREDRLRSDFYYALTSLLIRVPPLRERLEELPVLAQHGLERANDRGARRHHGFTPEALEVLAGYDWPGNLRELGRVIDAAHERAAHDLIGAGDLPASIQGHLGAAYTPPVASTAASRTPMQPLDATLELVERRLIEQALQRARHNKSRAADLLQISRPRLYRRIKELGLPDLPEGPDEPGASGTTS